MVVKANIAEAACRSVLDRVPTRVGSGLLITFDAREEPASTSKEKSRRGPAPPTIVAVPPPLKAATPPTPDLASLEIRLRATGAIGVFTKLSLKNQVSDLLDQFETFHHGGAPALATLRQEYDLLLLKVLSLLQNNDASLASAISASRESIWGILVDPAKFAQLG